MIRFERVAVIGVGLIGASFALALKKKRLCRHVVGVGRSAANMRVALRRGAVDSIETDVAQAVIDADLVLVATPVAQFERIFREIRPHLKLSTILCDAGSTKRDVVAAARKGLGKSVAQFVPGHPVAGAEKSGAAAANGDLFKGKRVILTPLPENSSAAVKRIQTAWSACGARVSRMSPAEHDAVFAAVSHLPHLLAFALVSELGGRKNSKQLFGYAAGGFRDFTRIASSHPEMWRDICMANRDRLVKEVLRFSRKLNRLNKMLEARNAGALQRLFAGARSAREKWLNGGYE